MSLFERSRSTVLTALLLLAIISTAGWLRFSGLTERGVVLWDAAYYLLRGEEAKSRVAYTLSKGLAQVSANWSNENNPCLIKPGHVLMQETGQMLLGAHDYAVLGVQATCGLLAVWMIFLIGRRLYGTEAGIVAAALIGAAGLAVAMSRTGWPQADSFLLVTLAIFFYQRSSPEGGGTKWLYLVLCGLACGLITGFHLLSLSIFLTIMGTEAVLLFLERVRTWQVRLGRIAVLGVCFVAVPLVAGLCLRAFGIDVLRCTLGYMNQGSSSLTGGANVLAHVSRLLNFNKALISFSWYREQVGMIESPFMMVAAVAGPAFVLVQAVARRRPVFILLALQCLLLTYYSLWIYCTAKAIHGLYMIWALGAGALAAWVLRFVARIKGRLVAQGTLVVLVAGVLVWGTIRAMPWVEYRSAYKQAAQMLVEAMKKNNTIVSLRHEWTGDINPVLNYYMLYEEDVAGLIPQKMRWSMRRAKATHYVLLDYRAFVNPQNHERALDVARHYEPNTQIPNMERSLLTIHYHRPRQIDPAKVPELQERFAPYLSIFGPEGKVENEDVYGQ